MNKDLKAEGNNTEDASVAMNVKVHDVRNGLQNSENDNKQKIK